MKKKKKKKKRILNKLAQAAASIFITFFFYHLCPLLFQPHSYPNRLGRGSSWRLFSGEAITANREKPFINQTASTFYPKRIVNQRSRQILRRAGKSLCFVIPTFPSHFRCTLYFISHFPLLAVDQVVGTFTCLLKIRQGAPDGLSPLLERKECVIISWRLAGKSISFKHYYLCTTPSIKDHLMWTQLLTPQLLRACVCGRTRLHTRTHFKFVCL